MARITVHINDSVLEAAERYWTARPPYSGERVNRSQMVTYALSCFCESEGRPAVSERGRLETLRSLRALGDALRELEAGLTQERPVRRRVRRYAPPRRSERGG